MLDKRQTLTTENHIFDQMDSLCAQKNCYALRHHDGVCKNIA